jgi:hypothetical protein
MLTNKFTRRRHRVSGRRSSQQLVQYATTSARRNRLSAASEEALVEFSQVRLRLPSGMSHSHSIGQLGQEEKLIDLWSKVARIEQRMDLSETPVAGSQPNLELPHIPTSVMVNISANS